MIELIVGSSGSSRRLALIGLLATALLPLSAAGVLMTETGPEAIILQVKDSIRQSDDFDVALVNLALLERQERG